jgi:hypothetical protein
LAEEIDNRNRLVDTGYGGKKSAIEIDSSHVEPSDLLLERTHHARARRARIVLQHHDPWSMNHVVTTAHCTSAVSFRPYAPPLSPLSCSYFLLLPIIYFSSNAALRCRRPMKKIISNKSNNNKHSRLNIFIDDNDDGDDGASPIYSSQSMSPRGNRWIHRLCHLTHHWQFH